MDGEEMAAEPVPVRRPGFTESGLDDWEVAGRSTGSETGSRNIGLKLAGCQWTAVGEAIARGAYRNASQRSSIHDAQFETITSPALGLQLSGPLDPRSL